MYQALTFLLLQLLLFIPLLIVELLTESWGWDANSRAKLGTTLFIVFELVLLTIIVRRGKSKFEQYIELRRTPVSNAETAGPVYFQTSVTETQLEISLGLAAVAGLIWCFLMGVEVKSVQILFIVIEGAAILFLSIFIIIRYLTTRKIRPAAIACLILSSVSIWALIGS